MQHLILAFAYNLQHQNRKSVGTCVNSQPLCSLLFFLTGKWWRLVLFPLFTSVGKYNQKQRSSLCVRGFLFVCLGCFAHFACKAIYLSVGQNLYWTFKIFKTLKKMYLVAVEAIYWTLRPTSWSKGGLNTKDIIIININWAAQWHGG